MCKVSGKCVLLHHLFEGKTDSTYREIVNAEAGKKEKKIIQLLQIEQPPKISGAQISRYFSFLKKGINLDKDTILKKPKRTVITSQKKAKPKAKSPIINTHDGEFIMYGQSKCLCVGFVDRSINSSNGGVPPYSHAYLDKENDLYVFVIKGEKRAYYKQAIEKFIKPFFPVNNVAQSILIPKKKKKRESLVAGYLRRQAELKNNPFKNLIERMSAEPEPNFHEPY